MKHSFLKSNVTKSLLGLMALTSAANAFDSIPYYESKKSNGWQKTVMFAMDDNFKKGSSDANGDYKAFSYVLRKEGKVLAIEGSLTTPQVLRAAMMRDTAVGKITAGYENNNWGIYGSFGTTREPATDIMYGIVDMAHRAVGMNAGRRSALTKTPPTVISIAGRRDYAFGQQPCANFCVRTHVTAFGVLGNLDTHVGLAAYAVIPLDKKSKRRNRYKPHIDAMPTPAVSGTHLYGGMRVRAVAIDAAVEGYKINPYRAELVVGIEHKRKRVGYGLEYSRQLTSEIQGAQRAPVSKIMARVSWSF